MSQIQVHSLGLGWESDPTKLTFIFAPFIYAAFVIISDATTSFMFLKWIWGTLWCGFLTWMMYISYKMINEYTPQQNLTIVTFMLFIFSLSMHGLFIFGQADKNLSEEKKSNRGTNSFQMFFLFCLLRLVTWKW